MSDSESEESEWTEANLQKLLAAMKSSIAGRDRSYSYIRGLKSLDWNKVAFPPFSAEECQEKWTSILQKMRKTRTLTELIVEAEGAISSPLENKRIHPEVPKKPPPANAMFVEENWAKLRKKHPEMATKQLLKLIHQNYKELSDKEKEKYEEKHRCAATKYDKKLQEIRERYQKPSKRKRRKEKQGKEVSEDGEQETQDADGLPPKPPFCGYNLFCREQQGSMAGISKDSYLSVWARRWRDLTETQRKEYNTRCTELKRQYSVKLNEYLTTLNFKERQQIVKKHRIKISKIVKENADPLKNFPGEPKMPPRACNLIFFKNEMNRLKKKIPITKNRFKQVSQMWKSLSSTEKESYKAMANERLMKYTVELQNWFQTLKPEDQSDYLKHNPGKIKYLSTNKTDCQQETEASHRPSDSEDEDIEYSSSDDDVIMLDSEENEEQGEEEEEEEEEEGFMFEMY